MTVPPAASGPRDFDRLWDGAGVIAQSERQLLDRFVAARDERAFEAIVARHGPMVVGVCRSVLTDPSDVDDAFQATFLVLARKAGSLRDRDGLSPWLHGVARRVSLRARTAATRRRRRETPGTDVVASAPDRSTRTTEERERAALLHAELDRLSLPERSAVLLCDLEGLTHQEAADQLGWPLGTVKSRVARGRDRLRSRLVRRGVTLSSSALTAFWVGEASASAPVVRALLTSTTRAALAVASAQSLNLGLISAPVFSLTQGAVRAMTFTKLKVLAAGLAAVTVVVAAPGVVAYQALRPQPTGGGTVAVPSDSPRIGASRIEVKQTSAVTAPVAAELSPRDLAILKRLEGPNPLRQALSRFAGGSPTGILQAPPFVEIMGFLTEATVDPAAGLPEGIPIQFTGIGKRLATVNNLGTVAGFVAGDDSTPLRAVLASEAAKEGLEYRVAGGVLTFDEAKVGGLGQRVEKAEVRQRLLDDDQRNDLIRAKLDRVIPLNFPNKVSLTELVTYLKKATRDGDEKPIPIYLDPRIFGNEPQNIAKSADDPAIVINLDDVPLRTSLRLALIQMHLEYAVSGGLLIIGGQATGNAGIMGGGMGTNGSPGIGDLVEPRDRRLNGMGGQGGFR